MSGHVLITEGGIIQVADMIAGEIRDRHGVGGPFLSSLGKRICLV
jgi:hypothetical protein